ncbi:hypothetical protein G9A89_004092 [Geosiphon pyriformis]|nr:hypothetical protein G9A89_004092 [Geosiphon pyriformis]
MPSGIQLLIPQPDFGATTPWELSEKEEEESEDQGFTYQNPISENLEFRTPNPNIPPNIIIDHPPIDPIVKPIQQPPQQPNPQIQQPQGPPQQPLLQQQLLQQPQQQLNVNQMAYAPIAKLKNFTGEEDNAQAWINDIFKAIIANNWDDTKALQAIPYFLKETINFWYQSLAARPQTFQQFKTAFLRYFSNNNSINCLANTFTTIKQNNTKAVTIYLGCFHRVLCQIQAIDAMYFTEPQILNQFIHGLCSSILQHIRPLHPANLQATVTHAKDFESAELEANHTQPVNLVINGSSDLDSKLKQIRSHFQNSDTGATQNPNCQNYLSLLITPEDVTPSNLETNPIQKLTSNIPLATVTENETLVAIFLFEFEKTIPVLLFSRAILEEKPITAIACIIIADGATKTPIGEIDDFPFEINGIIILIKVLVMETTQYQALMGNNWLSKTHTTLDWTTQELQLTLGDSYPHDKKEIWQIANAKVEGATPSEILEIKNNSPELVNIICIPNPDAFMNEETGPENFHKYYQNLAPTKEEQKQWLEQLNIQLYDHCLIPCDFQYCNECDLIYNPLPCIIYTIPEEIKPISSCTSELESPFNSDSNSDNNDDENTSSSSVQIGNNNDNNSNSDSNSDPKYEQYIALPDLSKEQKLKWYSDNNKSIMPKRVHNTDAKFDLRYSRKDAIKLEPHLCTCIDLKVALEISATTMVQLIFRSSLVKRGINIRGEIIDAGYVGNIIAMLQNDSEKAYIIEPNEKIAQAIFLPLVKIAQLVLVENREELEITAREIQGFGSTGRIDVPVNMVKEKIVDQEKIISTGQAISILSYGQYIVGIKWKIKEQNQIFETEPTLCELGVIGLINLHILAKDYSHIKILIYNNTGNVIVIPARTTIGYLSTEIKDQSPSIILDFPQLCGYVNITSQTIYR